MTTDKYTIIRFYAHHDQEIIKRGLTLEEAHEHCGDEETSSRTAVSPKATERTERYGPWFDGYSKEQ